MYRKFLTDYAGDLDRAVLELFHTGDLKPEIVEEYRNKQQTMTQMAKIKFEEIGQFYDDIEALNVFEEQDEEEDDLHGTR